MLAVDDVECDVVMVDLFDAKPSSLKSKLINLAIGFINIAACFLTQSRTLLVGLVAGAVFFCCDGVRGKRRDPDWVVLLCWAMLPVGMAGCHHGRGDAGPD